MDIGSILIVIATMIIGWKIFRRSLTGRQERYQDHIARVIGMLKAAGTNVLKVHNVEFFLYFRSRESAEAAQFEIRSIGLVTQLLEPSKDGQWLCMAMKEMLPIQSQLVALSDQLTAIAEHHNGKLDGWGTGVVE